MLISGERTGHLAQITAVTVLAIGFVVQKDLAARYPPADIVALQCAVAAVLMWATCWALGYLPTRLGEFVPGFAWGFLMPGAVFLFTSAGAARTDGVSVALIWGLLPLVGPVLARLILGERFHWSLPFGAAIAFLGLVVLTLDRRSIGIGDLAGDLLVAAGVLSASFGQIIGRKLNTRGDPWFRMATLQVTGGTVAAALLAGLDGAWSLPAPGDTTALFALAYLVAGMTIVNFVGLNLALSRIPVAWAAFYNSLNPAVGTLAAVVLLSALVRPVDLAGLAIIIAGVATPHLMRIVRRRP
jgi:drug/metabolite transporter (DMT)-like permease